MKNNSTNIEEYKIDVTVGNGQNMKCEIKGIENMKLKVRGKFKLNDILYLPQVVKNILSVSRLISKESKQPSRKMASILLWTQEKEKTKAQWYT